MVQLSSKMLWILTDSYLFWLMFYSFYCHIIDSDFCVVSLRSFILSEEREKYQALVLITLICTLNKAKRGKKSQKYTNETMKTLIKVNFVLDTAKGCSNCSIKYQWPCHLWQTFFDFTSFDLYMWHHLTMCIAHTHFNQKSI